jgi:hypothetical protein
LPLSLFALFETMTKSSDEDEGGDTASSIIMEE